MKILEFGIQRESGSVLHRTKMPAKARALFDLVVAKRAAYRSEMDALVAALQDEVATEDADRAVVYPCGSRGRPSATAEY